MSSVLKVKNICFTYPNDKGVRDISFDLKKDEILCLFGKNGSGKSTLFKVLSTLVKPQSGDYFIQEKNAVKKKENVRKYFFTVFDENAHFDYITGRENINFFIDTYKSDKNSDIEEICKSFDLDLDMDVCEYSYGMKRKLYIIEAFLSNTNILFFDEPTLGLDSLSRELFFKMLRSKKVSTIIGTNRLEDVKFADRTLLIEKGKIKQIKNYDSLLSNLITIKITTENDEITDHISSIQELSVLIENYTKHYHIKRIDIIDEKKDLEWTKEAIEKIERAPAFVRKMVCKLVEEYAKKSNICIITADVVDEVRRRFEHR